MLCIPNLRIAILNEELALWEKRLRDKPDDIPYLGYIRTTLKDRIKELEKNGKSHDNIHCGTQGRNGTFKNKT